MTAEAGPIRGNPLISDLVTRAGNGDKQAWDALVERYAPLVWSICRRHRLGHDDAYEAAQSVWLQLLDQLDTACDPALLPGWLAATTERESVRVLCAARRTNAAGHGWDDGDLAGGQMAMARQELLFAERRAALREAFAHLSLRCQQLIGLLIEDSPVSDAEISARLGIPAGSIEPSRAHCLDKLRRYPAVAALINAEANSAK